MTDPTSPPAREPPRFISFDYSDDLREWKTAIEKTERLEAACVVLLRQRKYTSREIVLTRRFCEHQNPDLYRSLGEPRLGVLRRFASTFFDGKTRDMHRPLDMGGPRGVWIDD